jgi:lipopolysaccharide export system protein LptC
MNWLRPRGLFLAREWLLILLLALTGMLGWWWQQAHRPTPASATATERRPDFVVEGLVGLTFDTEGRPLRRLWATRLRHYPDDGSSELDEPLLLALNRDDRGAPTPPWQVQGDTGWISAAGDELLLQGNAVVRRDATGETAPLRLTSAELLVLPEFDYAETARFARLTGGEDEVTAERGLRVWFGEPMRAKLFGRVAARLIPKRDDAPTPPAGSAPPADPATDDGTSFVLPPRPDLPR